MLPSSDWNVALADFLLSLETARRPKTVAYYASRLQPLARWSIGEAVSLVVFNARHLRGYLKTREGVSAATLRHDAKAAKRFLAWCKAEGYVERDPLANYASPRAPKPYVPCPTPDAVSKLLACMETRWKTQRGVRKTQRLWRQAERQAVVSLRDLTIFTGLVDTGCRVGELLSARLEDLRLEEGLLTFRQTKTGVPRAVPLSLGFQKRLLEWLRVRGERPSPYLFLTEGDKPLTPDQMNRRLRFWQTKAGVSGFSTHGIRHLTLTEMARIDVLGAAAMAGHADIHTTNRYAHRDVQMARETRQKASALDALIKRR